MREKSDTGRWEGTLSALESHRTSKQNARKTRSHAATRSVSAMPENAQARPGFRPWRPTLVQNRGRLQDLPMGCALVLLLSALMADAGSLPHAQTGQKQRKPESRIQPELIRNAGKNPPVEQAPNMPALKRAARKGDAKAQYNLGVAYDVGQGVPQDRAEALRWLKKAADQGNAMAQLGLGIAYYNGKGVPQDFAEAYFWTNLAAALNKNARGDSNAKLRDDAAARLSPTQLSATQKRCRQWMDAFEKRKAQK